jgi:hypothetical protein
LTNERGAQPSPPIEGQVASDAKKIRDIAKEDLDPVPAIA